MFQKKKKRRNRRSNRKYKKKVEPDNNFDGPPQRKRRNSEIIQKCTSVDIDMNELSDHTKRKICLNINKSQVIPLNKVNNIVKFNIIYSLDTFNYLTEQSQYNYFDYSNKILKKNGFFLIHYPQSQLSQKINKNIFNYEISKKIYKENYFFGKENPIVFMKDNKIFKLIIKNKNKFKLISSIFDTNTVSKNNSSELTINRYLLFKKK